MDEKPRKLISPICFIVSIVLTAVICFGIIWLVHNAWRIVAAATGDNQLIEIFKQLEEAFVMPPILIAVLAAGIIGFVMSITRKKKALMIILSIVLFLLTAMLIAVFTEVNKIPLHTIAGILISIVESGVL